MSLGEGWRLSVGTLTAFPAHATTPTPRTARLALLLAPLAVLPLGVAVALLLLIGGFLDVAPVVLGVLAVGLLALGTRALHWDGLSDVADGLTASYDRERSLAVMRTGTSGPAGTLALVLVALLQVAGFAALSGRWWHALLAGAVVCLARCALWLVCARGVPSARPEGLGVAFAGAVPRPVAALGLVLTGVFPGLLVLSLVERCVRRFGGVTGDVMGAAVEGCLAAMLVLLSVTVTL